MVISTNSLFFFFKYSQTHLCNTIIADFKENIIESNDSTAAILSMVPPVFHKYLTTKTKNNSNGI